MDGSCNCRDANSDYHLLVEMTLHRLHDNYWGMSVECWRPVATKTIEKMNVTSTQWSHYKHKGYHRLALFLPCEISQLRPSHFNPHHPFLYTCFSFSVWDKLAISIYWYKNLSESNACFFLLSFTYYVLSMY